MTYVKVKDFARNEVFILGEQRVRDLYRNKHVKEYEILDKFKGSELVGIQYVPIFQYYESRRKKGCFQVLSGNVAD